jgi:sugar-specific transcriptional regulator TrmB
MIDKLQKFGLSDKEARVCTALFEIPGSVVTDVAKKAGINRSTAYVLLESLGKRGLVSISERRGVRVYSPVSADRLIEIAETELAKSKELLELSRELATALKKMSVSEPIRTKIKAYEGVEGVRVITDQKLNAKENIRSYTAIAELRSALPRFFTEYEKKYASKGLKTSVIIPDTSESRAFLSEGATSKETYLAPDTGYKSGLDAFDSKVTFISPEENVSFIIESPQFAKAIKSLFDLALGKTRKWNVGLVEKAPRTTEKDKVLVKAQNRFFSKS